MDKIVIGDYHHMKTMDDIINCHFLFFLFFVMAPFCTPPFTSKFLIAFLDVNNKEEQYPSLMYTMYNNVSNNTPLYTHVNSYLV